MLLDNKSQGRVIDALREALTSAASVNILTNALSVFARDALRVEMRALSATRFLLTPPLGEPWTESSSLLMESSIHSFAQTVGKLRGKVQGLLGRIDAHEGGELETPSIEEIDLEGDDFAGLLVGHKVKVLLSDVDRVRWHQDLREGEEVLTALLRDARCLPHPRARDRRPACALHAERVFARKLELNTEIKRLEQTLSREAATL